MLNNGEKNLLRKNLRLEYPDDAAPSSRSKFEAVTSSPQRSPVVYLSYGSQDERVASVVRESLEAAGIDVLDKTRLKPGEPWSEAVQRMIARSDAVVGLSSENDISPFVISELGAAAASAKPSVALLPEGNSGADLPENVKMLAFDRSNPRSSTIADFVRTEILDLL